MLIKSLVIAFSMYSKIPMPHIEWDEKGMRYVFCFFPLIGVIIGVIMYCLGMFLINNAGNILFGCIMSVIPVFITGGIHIDGFLDTMDGICSYADKEKRLEILKDSNSGAFAVIGGIVYFVLSVGFWSEVSAEMLFVIAVGYCVSRTLSALSVVTFPAAKSSGLGAMFANSAAKIAVRAVMGVYLAAETVVLGFYGLKWCIMTVLVSVLCLCYHYYNCKKNFGGITGDLAGFFLQINEIAILGGCVLLGRIL